MPTILEENGYSVMVFTREPKEPAHVHVMKDRKLAKFWLESLEVAKNRGYRSHELTAIRRIIKAHQPRLKKAYEKIHGTK